MTRRTGFFTDERTFWHHAGPHALILPAGGWVQVPNGSSLAESPESKRRLKSLLDVSGLLGQLDVRTAPPATEDDLQRVHPAAYLAKLKALSDAGGGEAGMNAPVGPGTYEIARLSAGLAIAACEAVVRGDLDNAYSLSRPPGHHCLRDQAMGFCFLANIPVAIETMKARHGLGRPPRQRHPGDLRGAGRRPDDLVASGRLFPAGLQRRRGPRPRRRRRGEPQHYPAGGQRPRRLPPRH
jgi:hypothetical protein